MGTSLSALDCSPIGHAGTLGAAGAGAPGGVSPGTAGTLLVSLAAATQLATRWSEAVRQQRVALVVVLRLCFLAGVVRALPLQLPPTVEPPPSSGLVGLATARIASVLNHEVRFVHSFAVLLLRRHCACSQPLLNPPPAVAHSTPPPPPPTPYPSNPPPSPPRPRLQSLLLAASAALLPLPLWHHLSVHALGLCALLGRIPPLACLHSSDAERAAECFKFVCGARLAAQALVPGLPGTLPRPTHAATCCWMQVGLYVYAQTNFGFIAACTCAQLFACRCTRRPRSPPVNSGRLRCGSNVCWEQARRCPH